MGLRMKESHVVCLPAPMRRCHVDCGVTTDMERRLREHNAGSRGAKYTRARRPVELVCCVAQPDASSACRLEREVKQRPRAEKAAFLLARAERPPEEE